MTLVGCEPLLLCMAAISTPELHNSEKYVYNLGGPSRGNLLRVVLREPWIQRGAEVAGGTKPSVVLDVGDGVNRGQ